MFNTEGRVTQENMSLDLLPVDHEIILPSNQYRISCDNKTIFTYVEVTEDEGEEMTSYLISFSIKNNQLKQLSKINLDDL